MMLLGFCGLGFSDSKSLGCNPTKVKAVVAESGKAANINWHHHTYSQDLTAKEKRLRRTPRGMRKRFS
jgi:hypothetical protein